MTENSTSEGKRLALNTIVLYIRMVLSALINLYSIRLLWQYLGIDNYGIFQVVGAIVTMISVINLGMVATSQRFIAFELGRRNAERLRKVFAMSIAIHFLIALFVLLVCETGGLWYFYNKLNIPAGREIAAMWVYQCAIITLLINIVSVPYNACIVAHEHMTTFGIFGILEVLLKFAVTLLLVITPGDKLIAYAVMLVGVALLMRVIYGIYCSRHFNECSIKYTHDGSLMGEMFAFAGWSFLGNIGVVIREQGVNLLINSFFNVALNAAKGVASQVNGVIYQMAGAFQMAINPQITKRYSTGEIRSMLDLVFTGCKLSYCLLLLVIIPLIVGARYILNLWLDDVSEPLIMYLRLVLVMSLIDSMANPMVTAMHATGRIRTFQIVIAIILTATIPISWIWLKISPNYYAVMYVSIGISVIGIAARLILMHRLINFSYSEFLKSVVARISLVSIMAFPLGWLIFKALPMYSFQTEAAKWLMLIVFIIACVIATIASIYLLGLKHSERQFVISTIKSKFKK